MAHAFLTDEAHTRLVGIHQLSQKYNRLVKKDHAERLRELTRHHVDEIEELFAAGDPHALVETGDLLVLCCEQILERDGSLDAVLTGCLGRYEKKLTALIKETNTGAAPF
jgi:hypothetical protein